MRKRMKMNLHVKNVLPFKEKIIVNYATLRTYAKNAMVKEVIMVQVKYGYVMSVFLLVWNVKHLYIVRMTSVVEKEEVTRKKSCRWKRVKNI